MANRCPICPSERHAMAATVSTPEGKMCPDCARDYWSWRNAPAYAGPNDTTPDTY